MIHRLKKRTANIGIYAVGHEIYWDQFKGLLDNLMGYHDVVKGIVQENEVEVVDFGMVDKSVSAYQALEKMQSSNLDLLFVDMVTYAPSYTFAPIIRNMDVPVVLLALQPLDAMDYSQANTFIQLENDNVCSVP